MTRKRTLPQARPATSKAAAEPSRQPVLYVAIALCVLILCAYFNSLDNGFVWDDHEQIELNPYIKPGAPLAPLFTADVRFAHEISTEQTSVYRPLQLLAYRAVVAVFGSGPEAFHILNLLLAAAGALAAFAVFWLLTRRLVYASVAAALFAVHPIHTEAVNWIAALPDLAVGLFTLLALASFFRSLGPIRQGLYRALSLVAFALALLSKETAAVFPLLIAAYVLLLETHPDRMTGLRRALMQSAPYLLVLGTYVALRVAVLGGFSAGRRDWALNPFQYTLTACHMMLMYWAKLLLPVRLNVYYVFHPLHSLADPRALIAALLCLALLAIVVFLIRRAPLAAFAALWVLLTLLPALNLNGLGRNAFAERYLYLPSAGFCLLATLAAAALLQRIPARVRRTAAAGIFAVILAACVTQTVLRNSMWKDDSTLFTETLKLSPDAPFVRYMVASSQSTDPALTAEAERNYRQTIALAQQQSPPDRLDALAAMKGLASFYADRGQSNLAIPVLAQARNLAPNDADLAAEQAMILTHAGHGHDAEAQLAAGPQNENVLAALGLIARDEDHDLPRAAQLFTRALAAHPQADSFAASQHNNLGAVYGDRENFTAALSELRQAVALAPSEPDYRLNLASVLAALGRFPEARHEAETALRLAPNNPAAIDLLNRIAKAQ